MNRRKIELIMGIILLAGTFFLVGVLKNEKILENTVFKKGEADITVVIDPGHGGIDPGKEGINKALEKDINLSISKKLKQLLEKNNINVIMTRTDDAGLYKDSDDNKKIVDMKKRVEIIEKSKASYVISIHQNSYQEENVSGPQVFYHGQSKDGEALSKVLQAQLIEKLKPENKRVAKSNESYYILKETTMPTVIVECGFLSNYKEADLLITDEYQNKVAQAICDGVLEFSNKQ